MKFSRNLLAKGWRYSWCRFHANVRSLWWWTGVHSKAAPHAQLWVGETAAAWHSGEAGIADASVQPNLFLKKFNYPDHGQWRVTGVGGRHDAAKTPAVPSRDKTVLLSHLC